MADLVCSFFCFRSLTTNYKLPWFLPPRKLYSSALHSHNSRIKRTSPHLLPLSKPSPFAAPASEIDVISTHEHSDGSLIFRFGDPSEIQENVEIEEPKNLKEEIEGEETNGSGVVLVIEGADETESSASGLIEANDHADSIVNSSTTATSVEGENEFYDKSFEDLDGAELPVLTSNEESLGIFTLELDIERSENVEDINEEKEDLSPVGDSIPDESLQKENSITTAEASLEEASNVTYTTKETEITSTPGVDVGQLIVNVEECLNQEDFSADASILDQVSEVVDKVTTVAFLEKESDDISSADIGRDQSEKVDDALNGDNEGSPEDASVLDKTSEIMNGDSPVALSEKETDGVSSTSDIEIEPSGNVEEFTKEEYGDSPVDVSVLDKSSRIVNGDSTVASLETETDGIISTSDVEIEATVNVEKFTNEEYEDSLVDTSVLDKRSELLNNITTAAASEKETADITSADIDIEHTGNMKQVIDELVEEPSSVGAIPSESFEVENNINAQDVLGEETADTITSVACRTDPVDDVLDTDAYQGSLENAVTTNVVPVSEYQNVEPMFEDEATSDGRESSDDNLVSPSPQLEPAMNVEHMFEDEATSLENVVTTNVVPVSEHQNVEPMFEDEATGDVRESSDDNLVSLSPQVEPAMNVEPMFEDEATSDGSNLVSPSPQLEPAMNVEPMFQDEATSDGRESSGDNLVSPSPQLEPAMSLYKETDEPNLQAELQTLDTEESSESDTNNLEAIEMQNVLRNGNESDMYGAEAEPPTTEPAMTGSIGSEEQASGSGSGMPSETAGHVGEEDTIQLLTVSPQFEADSMHEEETGTEIVEEQRENDASEDKIVGAGLDENSVNEVMAPEYTESSITSQEMLMTDFVLSSGVVLLPHPSKVLTGGEDAYFVAGQTWLGVADGVGEWSLEEGTIAGVYALELLKNCETLVSDSSGNSVNSPIELLNLSVAQTQSPGSSTVLIAQFDGQALHVANVGNSGFLVLRHGAVYKRSSPMHHAFSLSVQIERGDDPSSLAQLYRVDLEEEDVIITATDGLLDNLYDQEILLITMKSLAAGRSLEEVAALLGKKAQEVGSSASARSPFADEAQAAGFPGYTGGKLDDVAVIVSLVRRC